MTDEESWKLFYFPDSNTESHRASKAAAWSSPGQATSNCYFSHQESTVKESGLLESCFGCQTALETVQASSGFLQVFPSAIAVAITNRGLGVAIVPEEHTLLSAGHQRSQDQKHFPLSMHRKTVSSGKTGPLSCSCWHSWPCA